MYNLLVKFEVGRDCTVISIIYIVLRIVIIIFCIVSFIIFVSDHEGELDYCDFGIDDYCWFSWKVINFFNMA